MIWTLYIAVSYVLIFQMGLLVCVHAALLSVANLGFPFPLAERNSGNNV